MRPVGSLFSPASVAVIGASERPGSWGNQLALGALRGRHRREVTLVNPRGGSLDGHRFTPVLDADIELAVVAVPPDGFETAVVAALSANARAVVGVTAGLPRAVVDRVSSAVRAAGAVLLGPNCMGVADADAELNLLWGELPVGEIALLSQSGNLSLELGAIARRSELGFRRFASLGDCADLGPADLLAHVGEAPVVALYLEQLGDARALLRSASALVDEDRHVVLLAAGRSVAGAAAAASHTGALASDHAILRSAARDAGVQLVRTPTELIEATRLRRAPTATPRSASAVAPSSATGAPSSAQLFKSWSYRGRLGIVADGGGHGVVAADLATDAGLIVAPPVDLAGAGEQDLRNYARAVAALVSSGEVDTVLLSGYFGGYCVDEPSLASLEASVADEIAAIGNVAVHSMTRTSATLDRLIAAGVPVWSAVEHAIAAVAHLAAPRRPIPGGAGRVGAGEAVPCGDSYWWGRFLLPSVRFPAGLEVVERQGALGAAELLGYPVACKRLGGAHKSDAGGVVLGITDPLELFAAVPASAGDTTYAIESMVTAPGVEMIVGTRRDPSFGPVVLVGLGGVRAELLADTAVALAPVDRSTARSMIDSLRGAPLLRGYRGSAPMAADALADAIVAVSELLVRCPGLESLELNPVLVTEHEAIALDCAAVAP